MPTKEELQSSLNYIRKLNTEYESLGDELSVWYRHGLDYSHTVAQIRERRREIKEELDEYGPNVYKNLQMLYNQSVEKAPLLTPVEWVKLTSFVLVFIWVVLTLIVSATS